MAEKKAPTVLIVDRKTSDREELAGYLNAEGYEVTFQTKDPKEALRSCYDNKYDVAFISRLLKDADGYELCYEILKELKNLYVVIIKEDVSDRDVHLAKNVGARGFVGKPYSKGMILTTMNKFEMARRMPKRIDE